MPANLPPQAKALERKYLEAKTLPEKIAALEAYLSAIPDHKGTEKLKGHLRRKLAQLKRELEEQRRRKVGGGKPYAVKKEGAAQVVLLGLTKSGKSALLAALTNAKPEIADYPFTTTEPYPGMIHYQDVQIQLVEAPALAGLGGEELEWTPKVLSLARNADGIVLVVDGQNNPLEQAKLLVKVLYDSGITVERKDVKVEIEKTTIGGVQVVFMNKSIKFSPDDVRKLLLEHGVRNAVVKIWGEASLEDVAEALMTNRVYKPAVIAVNKLDDDLREGFDSVAKFFEDKIPVVNVSAVKKVGLDALKKTIYESLGIIRVYTKEVNGEVASRPLILKKGARVIDVAKAIHSQIYKNFKYARIWGPSVKYGGEKVGADHTLMDGDIVEIHTK